MNARSRLPRWWQVAVSALALALPLVAVALRVDAAPQKWKKPSRKPISGKATDAGTESPDSGSPLEEGTTVRINHIRSSWQKVIESYAEAAHLQLVADAFPEGYFSRFDRKDHTPEAALRLLNRELDPLGFRLIVKGEFLVVMELKQKRREYRPAVVPDAPTTGETDNPDEEGIVQASAVEPARPKAKKATPRATQAVAEEPAAPPRRSRGRVIEQLSGEEDESIRSEPAPQQTTLTNVRLKSRDAVTVSRIIYGAFKAQAELVEEGPRGLQGFRVFRVELDKNGKPLPPMPNSPVRFTVGIDQEKNQLVIEATPQETPSVVRLIKTLDIAPKGEGTVKAISTNKDAGQIAESLQPELDRLAAASKKATRRAQVSLNEGDEPDADAETEPEPGRRLGQGEEMGQPGGTESLIGSLKGEVSVESVPDLGILIIRGNEKDVESVMSVIREIERLSIGTAPEVELVLLNHVNSESLASLLTSVYERLSPNRGTRGPQGQQQQNVLVIPIARPNAILIVAARVDIDSALKLADQLDQPTDPRTEYKVFRLKYAIPTQVVDTVETIYSGSSGQQGQQGQQNQTSTSREGLAPRVRITADARTNSVIVQARPRDMKEVALLIRDLDAEGSSAAAQIKIFPLKNALADELASVLQQAILSLLNPARITATQQGGQFGNQGGGQGQQGNPELREVKSQILQFLDKQGDQERMIQSGILADIRIAADLRTNSVVVTATESSMELIERLIRQFDRPTAAVAEIKVIPMNNGDAQSTVTLLNGLFGTTQQRQGQGANQAGQNFPGVQLNNADDASSTLIPLRFSVDIRTNSIIAIGGADALRAVHAIVLRLDESDIRQRKNSVYRLKNSPANDVALAIQQFLQTRNQVENVDPGLISPFEQIEREVVVVPEPVSNSLLISATPRFYKDVMQLVLELDAAPKQVLIQALLVEVQLDNADEWGVELGLQDSVLFDRSLISAVTTVPTTNTSPNGVQTTTNSVISATATPGYAFNNQAIGNNSASGVDRSTVGGQGLSSFNLGRINGDLGFGGLVLAAGSESVSALLRAVAARRRVDVLSRPQIRTLDNQLANIQVGQEVPRVNNFNVNAQTGYATPIVQQRSIGIILQVTPRISPEGMVVMEVVARKDALSTQSIPLFLNPNGSTVNSPIIDTTNALTTVSVRTGQTIVLGGMITKRDENIERKVPLLGDIPIVGQAFRYDYKRTQRSELLIFLTPRVIFNDAEAEMMKEIESQRVSFIEAEAELIHGPLFGVPAETPIMDTGAGTMFLEDGTPISPSEVTPVPSSSSPPPPPAPGIPMSHQFDDGSTPTTIMHGDSQPIPSLDDEDLNIDLSQRKKKGNRNAVVPAGYEKSRVTDKAAPGRTKLGGAAEKPAAPKPKKGMRQWSPQARAEASDE